MRSYLSESFGTLACLPAVEPRVMPFDNTEAEQKQDRAAQARNKSLNLCKSFNFVSMLKRASLSTKSQRSVLLLHLWAFLATRWSHVLDGSTVTLRPSRRHDTVGKELVSEWTTRDEDEYCDSLVNSQQQARRLWTERDEGTESVIGRTGYQCRAYLDGSLDGLSFDSSTLVQAVLFHVDNLASLAVDTKRVLTSSVLCLRRELKRMTVSW